LRETIVLSKRSWIDTYTVNNRESFAADHTSRKVIGIDSAISNGPYNSQRLIKHDEFIIGNSIKSISIGRILASIQPEIVARLNTEWNLNTVYNLTSGLGNYRFIARLACSTEIDRRVRYVKVGVRGCIESKYLAPFLKTDLVIVIVDTAVKELFFIARSFGLNQFDHSSILNDRVKNHLIGRKTATAIIEVRRNGKCICVVPEMVANS
jgi:hypothetical protein